MSDPLGDATRRRLTDAAVRQLRTDGYHVVRPDSSAESPAVATRDGESISIEPLATGDIEPTTIVSRLAHAVERGRAAWFVVDDPNAERRVRDILTDPALLPAVSNGRRTFYTGPDRITVEGGGYACFKWTGSGDPTIRWRETDTPVGPVPAPPDVDASATDETGRPAVPRLVCEVDGSVRAVLAGVESLRVPPASVFPFAYARNGSDKRFRVRRGEDGTVIDDFPGFAAMREAGYVPIPMPLVPEHLLAGGPVDVGPEARKPLTGSDGGMIADTETDVAGVDDPDSVTLSEQWRILLSEE